MPSPKPPFVIRQLSFVICLLPLLLAASPGPLPPPIPLFNGKDLSNWSWHPGTPGTKVDETWSIKDGILKSAAKPTGYLASDKEYRDFVLTVEYRHLTKQNGGLFICIHGETTPAKPWPDALQIQGKFAAVGDLINQNKGMKAVSVDKDRTTDTGKDLVTKRLPAAEKAEKAAGEWNTLIITVSNGNLKVTLNDTLVNEATNLDPPSGKIGLQAEGAEMEFRKITLQPPRIDRNPAADRL